MPYPEELDRFTEKLNKKDNNELYVIEEKLAVMSGVFEGELAHDDIRKESIQIYTGAGLSGERVVNYFLSSSLETPWKLSLKLFSQVNEVFVTYETPGDRVEAGDINVMQRSIEAIQMEVERYKTNGNIDGGTF